MPAFVSSYYGRHLAAPSESEPAESPVNRSPTANCLDHRAGNYRLQTGAELPRCDREVSYGDWKLAYDGRVWVRSDPGFYIMEQASRIGVP
jgi:hypothetical protein